MRNIQQTNKEKRNERTKDKLLDTDSPQEAVAREAGGRGAEPRRLPRRPRGRDSEAAVAARTSSRRAVRPERIHVINQLTCFQKRDSRWVGGEGDNRSLCLRGASEMPTGPSFGWRGPWLLWARLPAFRGPFSPHEASSQLILRCPVTQGFLSGPRTTLPASPRKDHI